MKIEQSEKGTIEQLFNLKSNQIKFVAFLDLLKAFDTVWRTCLLVEIHERGIKGKIWKAISSIYSHTTASIKLREGITKSFPVTRGVLQGSPLSPVLFNLFINPLAIQLQQEPGLNIGQQNVPSLFYCDDISLLAKTSLGLQKLINLCISFAKPRRLIFNPQKCKVMTNSIFEIQPEIVMLNSENKKCSLQYVKNFTYLGVNLDITGKATELHWKNVIKTFNRRIG